MLLCYCFLLLVLVFLKFWSIGFFFGECFLLAVGPVAPSTDSTQAVRMRDLKAQVCDKPQLSSSSLSSSFFWFLFHPHHPRTTEDGLSFPSTLAFLNFTIRAWKNYVLLFFQNKKVWRSVWQWWLWETRLRWHKESPSVQHGRIQGHVSKTSFQEKGSMSTKKRWTRTILLETVAQHGTCVCVCVCMCVYVLLVGKSCPHLYQSTFPSRPPGIPINQPRPNKYELPTLWKLWQNFILVHGVPLTFKRASKNRL